jgi:hypothetical protein
MMRTHSPCTHAFAPTHSFCVPPALQDTPCLYHKPFARSAPSARCRHAPFAPQILDDLVARLGPRPRRDQVPVLCETVRPGGGQQPLLGSSSSRSDDEHGEVDAGCGCTAHLDDRVFITQSAGALHMAAAAGSHGGGGGACAACAAAGALRGDNSPRLASSADFTWARAWGRQRGAGGVGGGTSAKWDAAASGGSSRAPGILPPIAGSSGTGAEGERGRASWSGARASQLRVRGSKSSEQRLPSGGTEAGTIPLAAAPSFGELRSQLWDLRSRLSTRDSSGAGQLLGSLSSSSGGPCRAAAEVRTGGGGSGCCDNAGARLQAAVPAGGHGLPANVPVSLSARLRAVLGVPMVAATRQQQERCAPTVRPEQVGARRGVQWQRSLSAAVCLIYGGFAAAAAYVCWPARGIDAPRQELALTRGHHYYHTNPVLPT